MAEHVERAAHCTDLGGSRVAPYDRHLGYAHTFLLGEVKHLGVVAKPVRGEAREDVAGDIAAEELEAALRVPDARQEYRLDDQVEDLAHQDAIDRLRELDA